MSQGAKASSLIAVGTTSSGAVTWLDWIPSDIGKLATLIGAVLSTVLICYWVQRIVADYRSNKLDHERKELELEKLRKELDE